MITPDHKICGMPRRLCNRADHPSRRPSAATDESGYALVALLALMTLLALFALAAAPSIRQQLQRDREKEAIFRGEQVADAIRAYYLYRTGAQQVASEQALPTSIDQLLEGIPIPGGSKKRQILRASAARDPLSSSGEWRLIRPRAPELIDFQQSVVLYSGNTMTTSSDRQLLALQQLAVPQLVNVLDTGSTESATVGDDFDEDYSGPFVGVASRSRNASILHFYDIEHHSKWIFTPLFR